MEEDSEAGGLTAAPTLLSPTVRALPPAWMRGVKRDVEAETRGYDANKKLKRRKRHLLVDTLGLVLVAWRTRARRCCQAVWRDGARPP
jgi:hypothetical protein